LFHEQARCWDSPRLTFDHPILLPTHPTPSQKPHTTYPTPPTPHLQPHTQSQHALRWLGSNLLRTAAIPSELSRLSSLHKLWLPSNLLVELPECICDLPALEWL